MNLSSAALTIFFGLISRWVVAEWFAARKRQKDKDDPTTGRAKASPRCTA